MIKIISKLLLFCGMVFGALFGVSWAEGNPNYWYIVIIGILFMADMGITIVTDKLGSIEFYKNLGLGTWGMIKELKNKIKKEKK